MTIINEDYNDNHEYEHIQPLDIVTRPMTELEEKFVRDGLWGEGVNKGYNVSTVELKKIILNKNKIYMAARNPRYNYGYPLTITYIIIEDNLYTIVSKESFVEDNPLIYARFKLNTSKNLYSLSEVKFEVPNDNDIWINFLFFYANDEGENAFDLTLEKHILKKIGLPLPNYSLEEDGVPIYKEEIEIEIKEFFKKHPPTE